LFLRCIWHFLTDVATLKLNKDIYTKIETLPHIIEKNKLKACGTLLDGKKVKRRLAEHF